MGGLPDDHPRAPRRAGAARGGGALGIGPVLLPADADGRPLRPAILYGVDTRATAEIDELTDELGADRILERGGDAAVEPGRRPEVAVAAAPRARDV